MTAVSWLSRKLVLETPALKPALQAKRAEIVRQMDITRALSLRLMKT
jgi:hypothetical protein